MEEITRQDIAKLLGVTPQRVSQYTFIPAPIRQDEGQRGRFYYYDKEKVLAAIAKQYPEPKCKVTQQCKDQVDKSISLQFIAGRLDPEERVKEYDALKYWAKTHSPKTRRVHIKGEFSVKGKDVDSNRSQRRLQQSTLVGRRSHQA